MRRRTMRTLGSRSLLAVLLVLAVTTIAGLGARAQKDDERGQAHLFRAELRGRNEVPLTLSGAHGSLELTVSQDESSAHFRSEEHTSELQSRGHLVCRLLLEKKKNR